MIVVYCSGFCPSLFYMVSALLLRSSNLVAPLKRELRERFSFLFLYRFVAMYSHDMRRQFALAMMACVQAPLGVNNLIMQYPIF